jgi:DNA mismatch repair protein MutS
MEEYFTPIRQQYLKIKKNYPGAIVLFRLGDFYETFDEDAKLVSRELEITLTSKLMGKGYRVPLAGIPYHALDNYLAKLIKSGHKVAICEQMTKPGETKGIVKRDVVRVVTPGTVVETGLLESKANNYLLSIFKSGDECGLAYVDITTSEFACTQINAAMLANELERLKPAEIIAGKNEDLNETGLKATVTRLEDYWFELETARESLLTHFEVFTLEGFGCNGMPLAIRAAGAVLHYIEETQKGVLPQLNSLATYSINSFMALDEQAERNLEVFQGARGGTTGSLLHVIDLTKTAMGGRLLRRFLGQPLLVAEELEKRQNAVEWLTKNGTARNEIISNLDGFSDLERLVNRVRSEIARPREVVAIRRSMERVPALGGQILPDSPVKRLKDALRVPEEVVALLTSSIEEQPGASLADGGVIRTGFSPELDKLRDISKNARQYLANMELQEREKTGIKSLKVGFNNVFGYYIEVSKANLSQVPAHYIRKQTLVNGERFFTPELKEYESLILNAKERIIELETDIFHRVCRQLAGESEKLLTLAQVVAELDVFAALAEAAVRYGYIRPVLNDGNEIVIKEGRHPVVERSLGIGSFVANDVHLSNDASQIIVLTGPNMSGKSTYLKQVAIITLMAQIGSFVPAKEATIGLVDRIFTRIGAREDMASGQSTFMVEMVETANILNNATEKSLIILDEIGRGTSTYDGLAIARAVTEYIHNKIGAKTIFATHYHEMVEVASYLPRVRNFNVAVVEENGNVVFLREVRPGGVDKSYGIHVAKLAGLPRAVVHRAQVVLDELEGDGRTPRTAKRLSEKRVAPEQIPLIAPKSVLEEALKKLDVDSLSPFEALTQLYELKKKVGESK